MGSCGVSGVGVEAGLPRPAPESRGRRTVLHPKGLEQCCFKDTLGQAEGPRRRSPGLAEGWGQGTGALHLAWEGGGAVGSSEVQSKRRGGGGEDRLPRGGCRARTRHRVPMMAALHRTHTC